MIYDFEKPIAELEEKLSELQSLSEKTPETLAEIANLREKLLETKKNIYGNLTAWQRVQLARHIARPRSLDYINAIFTDWTELHGDRKFADDPAVVCGLAHFENIPVAVVGQQKGKDTRENLRRNFGMMHPEGYRKALRIMKLADKFSFPIIVFIDTPGAYPGIGAEERGQAEAIAYNIKEMFTLQVPIIVVIIGEGASGGALGVGLGDVVLMMENAWYCVISPEGCASILWRDRAMAPQSAEALKLTANDLLELKVIDEIIPEPLGGAHRDPEVAFQNVYKALSSHLQRLMQKSVDQLINERFKKYRQIGVFITRQDNSKNFSDKSALSAAAKKDEQSRG
ncbi:acetyl-CoA carboxylase carboxyltransferase subunit alpha [Candidatus Sumerlaeota bacterium]|nr:acetyl-CoA carboxylase carboxyltransferase subunit alpha [Candidatus Sumerlaeota bacterium]